MKHQIPINRIKPEIDVKTSRSSGPGGQHVNKTETRVQLIFNIETSQLLTAEEKEILKSKLGNQLTKEGALIVSSESARSQLKNKEIAFKKLDRLIQKAFTVRKKRKPTKPSKSAVQARLKEKKIQSEKKKQRGTNYWS